MAKDYAVGRESIGIQKVPSPAMGETLKWRPKWKIEKYANDEAVQEGKPFEVVEIDGNILLNVGITRLLNLLIGDGGTAYNNANAEIGVGDSTAAEDATQTDLQGTNKLYKGMDTGYPVVNGQTVSFRATFAGNDANYAWQEFSVRNGSVAAENLNRKVSDQGTKTGGQTWIVTLEITLS